MFLVLEGTLSHNGNPIIIISVAGSVASKVGNLLSSFFFFFRESMLVFENMKEAPTVIIRVSWTR